MREVFIPFLFISGGFVLVTTSVVLLWGLLSPGHYAGIRQAEKQIAALEKACEDCVSVQTAEGTLRGLLVAASPDDIAMYLPKERATRILARSSVQSMTSPIRVKPSLPPNEPDQSAAPE